jgi:hypothetical protein
VGEWVASDSSQVGRSSQLGGVLQRQI